MSLITFIEKYQKIKELTEKVKILPDKDYEIIEEMKKRFSEEINPSLWNEFLESSRANQTPENFFNETNAIIQDILRQKFPDFSDDLIEGFTEIYWEKSQAFWSEISSEFENNLIFIEKLITQSKNEINGMFSNAEKIFGSTAYFLLIDLAFQYNIYNYSRVYFKENTDFRRMINISGQIIEAIFSDNEIFPNRKIINQIVSDLKDFSKGGSDGKKLLSEKFDKTNYILNDNFIKNLNRISSLRGLSSHGNNNTNEDDFTEVVNLLLQKNYGILTSIYNFLTKNAK